MDRRSSGARLAVTEWPPPHLEYVGLIICLALAPVAAALSLRQSAHVITAAYPTRVRLPDGSRILLGAGSRLQFRDDFARRRRLWLFGHATIEVAGGTPFSIWTETAALKTAAGSFVIRATGAETTFVFMQSGTAQLQALNEDNDPAYRRLTVGTAEAAVAIRLVGTKLLD